MIESISPNTGKAFSSWNSTSDETLSVSLERLDKGTDWLTSDLSARRDVLTRALSALTSATDDLAALTLEEVGKTPPEAAGEIPYAASFLEVALELLDHHPFETRQDGRVILEVPRGTGLLIAPYNDPVAGLIRKIAPCLAAGAAALVKPSDLGVQCALRLKEAFSEAGLDSVIAILPMAEHERIARLVGAPEIGTVSFTGSTRVGLHLAGIAGGAGKAYVGELGGTNPFVLLADADLDRAIPDLVTRKIKAAGQACSTQNIVYADAAIVDEVCERISAALTDVSYGSAGDDGVHMGPVRTGASVARLYEIETRLCAEGARRLTGGLQAPGPEAPFLAVPTAYRLEEPGALAETEVFGPMMGICAFNDIDGLRTRLKANRQPLVLYLYGQDAEVIARVLENLRYGSIGVNSTAIQGADVPTGGFGQAGIGREGGRWGLAEFLTTVNRRGGE